MLPQKPGEPQQTQRIIEAEILGLLALRQGCPLRLRVVVADLAALHIGAVLTEEEVNQIAGFRIFTQRFRPISLLFQDQFSLFLIQICRRDLPRQGGLDELFLPLLTDALGLQISPEATDADHTGESLEVHGAGRTGIDVSLPLLNLGLQSLIALVEPLEVRQPLNLSVRDLIQGVLHPGGEAGVHQIGEVLLQQSGHGKGRETRRQGIPLQRGVTAIHDRADDRGVRGRAADPLLLQHLHQGCFAEPSGRLGLVSQRFHLFRCWRIPHRKGRQEHFLAFQRSIGVIAAFHIGAEEAGKVDALAAGPETGLSGTELHRQHREPGFRHLAGHGAFPDQFVHRQIAPVQTGVSRRAEAFSRGTDRLMGLLRVAGLGAELPRALTQILLAIERLDTASRGADRLIREMHRVGAHIGDETALIQPLGAAHRFACGEPQFAVGLLLQRARGERRHRFAHRGLLLDRIHAPGTRADRLRQSAGLLLA